jgi:hypothetical protein
VVDCYGDRTLSLFGSSIHKIDMSNFVRNEMMYPDLFEIIYAFHGATLTFCVFVDNVGSDLGPAFFGFALISCFFSKDVDSNCVSSASNTVISLHPATLDVEMATIEGCPGSLDVPIKSAEETSETNPTFSRSFASSAQNVEFTMELRKSDDFIGSEFPAVISIVNPSLSVRRETEQMDEQERRSQNSSAALIGGLIGGLVLLAIIGTVLFLVCRQNVLSESDLMSEGLIPELPEEQLSCVSRMSLIDENTEWANPRSMTETVTMELGEGADEARVSLF